MYGLFGGLKAHDGQREALMAYLLRAADVLRGVEGCHLYVVGAATDDPAGIWVAEVWRSQADHQASLALEAVREVIAAARPLIAGMGERTEFVPLGGKGLPE